MHQCPGCGKVFSWGYFNHLQQTQKPACHAVLAQELEELWSEPSDSESDTLVMNPLNLDLELDLDLDLDFESHDDEEDLMYGANDYEEVPVPEQLEGSMDIDDLEPENN